MSNRLRESLRDLDALVGLTARHLNIPPAQVEKDFWVTEVLRIASAERTVNLPDGSLQPVTFTFKGGTSLSRVFGIIQRFSEDVDVIATFPPEASLTARHRVFKQVDEAVRKHLSLTSDDVVVKSSTTGVKRYTTYAYPTERPYDSLKEGVLLELGSRGGAHPSSHHLFQSLIAGYATTELGEKNSTWEEFEPFAVTVLAPERTLFEKLAAVHDFATRMDVPSLVQSGRHFYDIYCLLTDQRVFDALSALRPEGKQRIVQDIGAHSRVAGFSWTERPEEGYASSPAFTPHHLARSDIEVGYSAAQELVHGTLVSLDDVVKTVHQAGALL